MTGESLRALTDLWRTQLHHRPHHSPAARVYLFLRYTLPHGQRVHAVETLPFLEMLTGTGLNASKGSLPQ